ncbi:MAG: SLBB domain-containing protein, partial [Deltaproteobacteria bacterium]|nr:SLBB domain-containing protein [Deltaproteobacteria bacterium]
TTLLEILAQAGGPTPEAGTEVILIRPRNHSKKENPTPLEEARDDDVIHLDVQQLMNGDMSQNIFLKNGDTIYITKAQYYYVFGEVERPGKFLHEKSITVLKALTTAGGITDVAAVNRTKIVREKEGMRVKFKVKMNDAVMPEDIIIVPESFF